MSNLNSLQAIPRAPAYKVQHIISKKQDVILCTQKVLLHSVLSSSFFLKKKEREKKKTKKPKVLTPKYMGHVQASSHKWWNSTLPTFLTVSFSEWDQYRSCGFICCPCASIISSPQIEKVTWLIASKHRESCSLSWHRAIWWAQGRKPYA